MGATLDDARTPIAVKRLKRLVSMIRDASRGFPMPDARDRILKPGAAGVDGQSRAQNSSGVAAAGRRAHRGADGRRRVLVLSADLGEGHASAARALFTELTDSPSAPEVVIEDGLVGLGPLLRAVIRDGSLFQFRRMPWVFGVVYWVLMQPTRRLVHAVLYLLGARNLLRLIAAHDPDVVVSTYPGINPVLGRLRRRGRLNTPVCTTILDMASLEFWVHPGVDLHLVMYPHSSPTVKRLAGSAGVESVRPLIAAPFYAERSRTRARRALDLPETGHLVVVTGGGWGIGDLDGAAKCALSLPETTVVCVAGRNETARLQMEAMFASQPRAQILGFTDRMSELVVAADVIVHPGGGVTCLEALVTGRPSIVYKPPPGHWRANASAMRRLGFAQVADSPAELAVALERAMRAGELNERTWPTAGAGAAVLAWAGMSSSQVSRDAG